MLDGQPIGASVSGSEADAYDNVYQFALGAFVQAGGGAINGIRFDSPGVYFAKMESSDGLSMQTLFAYPVSGGGGLDTTKPPTWTSGIFSGTAHSESHTFTGLTPATDYAIYGVIWSESSQAATEHHATATFRTLDGEVITPDFSDTSLYMENLEFTTNTADFDIGWMNLPETTDPNYVQYFISAELDDGTTTTNSTVYLFSSDMVEDGTHWFSFTALKPNTEYTVTARLLYNTTGAFSDFTDSGVSVTFDFTTEAGGFDRDSFLLGFTSGLCQTAATKSGAEYHNWMQGYIVGRSLRKAPAYSTDSM